MAHEGIMMDRDVEIMKDSDVEVTTTSQGKQTGV
jgi:hypothetical protein